MGVRVQTNKGERVLPLPSEVGARIKKELEPYIKKEGGTFTGPVELPAKSSFVLDDLRDTVPATEGQLKSLVLHIQDNASFKGVDILPRAKGTPGIAFHFGESEITTSSIDETEQGKIDITATQGLYVNGKRLDEHNHDDLYVGSEYVDQKAKDIVGNAPASLNTIEKLATSLNNKTAFATEVEDKLKAKVDAVEGKQLSDENYSARDKAKVDALGELSSKDNITTAELDEILKNAIGLAQTSYQKPKAGIGQSDLDEEVKALLAKASTAIQSLAGYAKSTELQAEVTRATTAEKGATDRLDTIEGKLPSLVTTDSLSDAISSLIAIYIGSFETKAALLAYEGKVTNNDYAYVQKDETHNNECWRYIYSTAGDAPAWKEQIRVNEAPLTTAQTKALDSGITAELVAKYNTLKNYTHPASHPASMIEGLADVATTGSYNDLTDKPNIPQAYVLKKASDGVLGGVALGYSGSGKNYPLLLDADGKAYVSVPWQDNTDTKYTADGTTISLTGTKFSLATLANDTKAAGPTADVTTSATEQSIVIPRIEIDDYGRVKKLTQQTLKVKDTNTVYSLPTATATVLGGVKSKATGTASGKDYYVEVLSDGTMKVNVPWSDTKFTLTKATTTALGGVIVGAVRATTVSATTGGTATDKCYALELDSAGKGFVRVPWTDTNTTYNAVSASGSAAGLMSVADKKKLDAFGQASTYALKTDLTSIKVNDIDDGDLA